LRERGDLRYWLPGARHFAAEGAVRAMGGATGPGVTRAHGRGADRRRSAGRLGALAALLLAAVMFSATPAHAADKSKAKAAQQDGSGYAPEDNFTATWKRADALKVRRDPTNTKPRIPADFPVMTNQVWVWDTWPLVDLEGRPVSYRGWQIIFSLVAPRTVGFGQRHQVATIGYFISRDGKSWAYQGEVFPGGRTAALGTRQWAGSATLVGTTIHMFYTASGTRQGLPFDEALNDPNWLFGDTEQKIAHATARLEVDQNGPFFRGQMFRDSKIVAEADGRYYQTVQQAQGGPIIYAFRDPFLFRDPADEQIYLLFEGNTPGRVGDYQCTRRDLGALPTGHTVPPESNKYTGNIGLGAVSGSNLNDVQLLPPLVSANCTNQQLERPHLVIHDGGYYLFTISHTGTYAPGLTGPDGVYGYLGESLRSDYRPLNGSALVLGNPEDAPFQQYSEYVMPNFLVESFVDEVPLGNDVSQTRSGGTLAPTLRLEVEGANTYFVQTLGYGEIPAMVNR
jgi:levansucrase